MTRFTQLHDQINVGGGFELKFVEAFELCAARFRTTGIQLAILDGVTAALIHHDEGTPAGLRGKCLDVLRSQTGMTIVSLSTVTAVSSIDRVLTPGIQVASFRPDCAPERVVVACGMPEALTPELIGAITNAIRETLLDQFKSLDSEVQLTGLTSHLADAYEELSLLYQVTGGMRVNRTSEDFFRTLCADVRAVLGARIVGAAIRPGRTRGNSLVVQGDLDLDPQRLARFVDETTELLVDQSMGMGTGFGSAGKAGRALIVNDLDRDPVLQFLSPGFKQVLAVPLIRDDHVLGFLFAVDKHGGNVSNTSGFDSVDAKLLTSVASASAVYCENSLLFDDLQGLTLGLLHSLTSAVDAKDSYTCGHSERVAIIGKLLATQSGFTKDEADRVYISGLLHDVGKIGVPEEVLRKPGKLTEEEFAAMKLHPQIGAKILADVRQIQDVIPGVLHHHERFDGRGYPYGLAGRDIPLMGRLLCLADSFDAMTTNRTYRRGMPLQQALEEIKRCSGAQFDPELAEKMIELGADRIADTLDFHREQQAKTASRLARAA